MLGKSRRHFRRYREIAAVLAKHGWGWALERIGIGEHLGGTEAAATRDYAPVHLRQILEELGPTFVKLGQLLSTRADIVPAAYISELAKLQDTAPTLSAAQVRGVMEAEFGCPVDELFSQFDETPLAAASLAQVHRATLQDGTHVIVKVQRPGIREQVETDIEILYRRAKFLEAHWEKARTYGVTDLVDEFAITIREELDYTREAVNTDRLREETKVSYVRLPCVYWDHTTSRVLTLELMRGTKITDIRNHPLPGIDPALVARRLAAAFLEQVFVRGYFHADPHPGNILVAPDGVLELVDCGQVGRLDSENRAGAVRMLMAFEQQDTRVLADEILNLGIAQEEVDVRRFTLDLGKVLRAYYDLPARAVNMGQLLTRVLNVSADHKIRLPVSFAVVGKVFGNIDGICRQLDPDFNLTEIARDYVGRAMRNELRSEAQVTELYRALVGLRSFVLSLPENLERLLRKAVEGTLRLEFKHLGVDEFAANLRQCANRISIALIVGSIIVGSSLIVAADRGGKSWFGLPALGIAGYLVATIFGIWLIFSIARSGRHH